MELNLNPARSSFLSSPSSDRWTSSSVSRDGLRDIITVRVDRCIDDPFRRYGLHTLSQLLGVPIVVGSSPRPDLYYGFDPLIGRSARVWIRAELASNWSHQAPSIEVLAGVPAVYDDIAPRVLVDRNRVEFDLILATAYWTSLASEQYITHRDAHGRVPSMASVLGQHDLVNRPPVHAYAELLARMLRIPEASSGLFPRWPGGKRWAALITHDVDLPERTPLARLLLREAIRPGAICRRDALYGLRAEIARFGLRESLIYGPTRRKEWDFARLCELERRANLRSAFFFATTNRRAGHACDVDYDIQQPRFRKIIRSLAADGFEIGLHAAYCTASEGPRVSDQLAGLSAAGRAIAGVRHHYLQLDHADPMGTLIHHADSGLRYDSSIGFNDAPGFRQGLAMPIHPYVVGHGVRSDFVELPMTLADMHLPTHDAAAAMQIVRGHLEYVRSLGGLAVLNWHVGHSTTHPGWRAGIIEACDILRQDDSVWTTTPAEMAEWWITRTAELDRATESLGGLGDSSDVFEWPTVTRESLRMTTDNLTAGRVPIALSRSLEYGPLAESA